MSMQKQLMMLYRVLVTFREHKITRRIQIFRFYFEHRTSVNDNKIIKAANNAGVIMAFAGTRHFKH